MPNVFIPIIPTRFDTVANKRRPVIDVSPARQYGDVKLLIEDDTMYDLNDTFKFQKLVDIMADGMRKSMEDDYVVAVGDPALIAACTTIQIQRHGKARVLRWHKQLSRYQILEFEL
jgi:hypothetical protein